MVAEVVLAAEGLPADVARVGPFVRVRPFVYQKIVTFRELSVAELADELFFGARRRAGRDLDGHGRRASRRLYVAARVVHGGVAEPLVDQHRVVRGEGKRGRRRRRSVLMVVPGGVGLVVPGLAGEPGGRGRRRSVGRRVRGRETCRAPF